MTRGHRRTYMLTLAGTVRQARRVRMVRRSRGAEPPATPGMELALQHGCELRARRPRVKRRRRARGPEWPSLTSQKLPAKLSAHCRRPVWPRRRSTRGLLESGAGASARARSCARCLALCGRPRRRSSRPSLLCAAMRQVCSRLFRFAQFLSHRIWLLLPTSDSAGGKLTRRVCCA